MVVATGKRELKLFGTQSKAIRETAEINIGTVVGSHLDSLPITIAEPQKKQALDMIRHYSGEEPPKVLETVNDIFFRNAAENNASTLGAVVLVYLSKADCQKAEEFISRSYHKFIAELLELRGHGNNIGLVLNESKILYLRSRLYELIRFLGE